MNRKFWLAWLALAVAVAFGFGCAVGAIGGPGSWDWGDVATWITGAATAGALILTSRALRLRTEQLSLQADEVRAEVERRERSHADRVAWWPAPSADSERIDELRVDDATGIEVAYKGILEVHYANASDLPIYNVEFVSLISPWKAAVEEIGFVPPGRSGDTNVKWSLVGFRNHIWLLFDDAGGRSWSRAIDGRLTLQSDLFELDVMGYWRIEHPPWRWPEVFFDENGVKYLARPRPDNSTTPPVDPQTSGSS